MAKDFAKLNSSNIVIDVQVVDDDNSATEAQGVEFLRTLLNDPTAVWKLSDDSTGSAGIDYNYDTVTKVFYEPQPYPSWTLQADKHWEPPVPKPGLDNISNWNEDTQSWDIESAQKKISIMGLPL